MRHGITIVGLFSLLGAGACAKNMSDDGDDDTPVDCSTVTADTFVVGLEHPGTMGMLDFKLMSATPAPPARGDNTWVVEIDSMASGVVGAPMDGASITVTPYMPAHGHGTGVVANVTATGTTGQYSLAPVNMFMTGVWVTTIAASVGTVKDSAVYTFCMPD
jgi:hypothetical protein